MNIAITCETDEVNGLVPKTFKEAPFLMIVDADKMQIFKIYGKQDEENITFAKKVLEHECEALICGAMEQAPFNLVAGGGVTRYDGSGHTAEKAFKYMNRYKLKWIADYIGGPGAFGGSHSGVCEGEDTDEEAVQAALAKLNSTRHIFLEGARHVGKSTLIEKLLEDWKGPVYGFKTKSLEPDENGFHPIYIHPAGTPEAERVYTRENCIGSCDTKIHNINPEVFDTLGVQYIEEAQKGGILVMDELGFMEAGSEKFTAAVLKALDGDIPILAAIKDRKDVDFLNRIRAHEKAEVYEITEDIRDLILPLLKDRMPRR